MFGTRMKIMWEEQFVDPPIRYVKSVIWLFHELRQDDFLRPSHYTTIRTPNYLGWKMTVQKSDMV